MIENYSVDHEREGIVDQRTANYFQEVVSSYTIGNYRSAVVMLWTVVVCDLIFKLQELADVYSDTVAQGILNDVEREQTNNPTSSSWENMLLQKMVESTGIFDQTDKASLEYLHTQRHLSAHPVIKDGAQLHRPNKDDVRAMMRSALERVLTKLPLVSKRILDQFLADLAAKQSLFLLQEDLLRYLESRYFARFSPAVEAAVFRSLWKLVFKVEDEICEANRQINLRALTLMAARDPTATRRWIANEPMYYSNVSGAPPISRLLVKFLAENQPLFAVLAEHTRTDLAQFARSDEEAFYYSSYQYEDLSTFLALLRARMGMGGGLNGMQAWLAWQAMRSGLEGSGCEKDLRILAVRHYTTSKSFDTAGQRFFESIAPDLDNYELDELICLMEAANSNSQCNSRSRAAVDHLLVKTKVLSFDENFNFAPYAAFLVSVSDDVAQE